MLRDFFQGERDHLGRTWTIAPDASVPLGFELITPPIYYLDIVTLQSIFRRLRRQGARRSGAAGIHVHVEASQMSPSQVVSLVNIYANYSDLILRLLNVYTPRRVVYCSPVMPFAERLARLRRVDFEAIRDAWYDADGGGEGTERSAFRYDDTRYTELNLHSLFYRKTVEFRAFNSTNHAGKIKSFVLLALALVSKASEASDVVLLSPVRLGDERNAVRCAREFFNEMHMTGPEFASAQKHFTSNLRRYYRQRRSEKTLFVFKSGAFVFDGSLASDVLDEMADNGFFLLEGPKTFLAEIRRQRRAKTRDPIEDLSGKGVVSKHFEDDEQFALEFLRALEMRGLGSLRMICGDRLA